MRLVSEPGAAGLSDPYSSEDDIEENIAEDFEWRSYFTSIGLDFFHNKYAATQHSITCPYT